MDQNLNGKAWTPQWDNMHKRNNIYVKKPVQENETTWTNVIKN